MRVTLSRQFLDIFEDTLFTRALEKMPSLTNEQKCPLNETQKTWTNLSTSKPPKICFIQCMANFRKLLKPIKANSVSEWLNVVPWKNLRLKLDEEQLWFSIGLRLVANICVAHTRHCGKRVERDGFYDFFLHQGCWSFLTSCYSQFAHKEDVVISRLAFNARAAWTRPN